MTQANAIQPPCALIHVGKCIHHIQTCRSTQEVLKTDYQNHRADLGTVLLADRQTHGRGQHGKSWEDGGGSQLFVSMLLPILFSPQALPLSNLMVALCVCETLVEDFDFSDIHVKWPNDIFFKGQKVGGVISELIDPQKCLMIGLGLNLSPHKNNAFYALDASHHSMDRRTFLFAFLQRLDAWCEKPTSVKTSFLRQQFDAYNLHQSQSVTVKTDHSIMEGLVLGINEKGQLLLKTSNDGTVIVTHGSIVRSL